MKKIFTVALLGTSLVLTSCGDKTETTNTPEVTTTTDDTNNGVESVVPMNPNGLSIAFYVQDSIVTGFDHYREVDSILQAKQRAFETKLQSEYTRYQEYEAQIQKRIDANEISAFDMENVQREAQRRQQKIAQMEQQEGSALQRESAERTTAIMNKIASAGREFAEANGIDMLLFYQKGGQITYANKAMDVTTEFINFLNKREKDILGGSDETESK